MAEKASLSKLHALQRKLETVQKRMTRIREVADDKVQHVVRATEVAGSAFALGAINGYYKEKASVGGIPLSLAAAVLLHGAGLFGIGGDMSGHLHAFGDGALATAAADFGRQVGNAKSSGLSLAESFKQAALPGDVSRSAVPGQRLTDTELAALSSGT